MVHGRLNPYKALLSELKRGRKIISMAESEFMLGNTYYRREKREGGDTLYNESKLGIIDNFKHIAGSRIPLGIPAAFLDSIEQLFLHP